MQIIRKGTTPNGTDIQIEDWSETYPGTFKKNATIPDFSLFRVLLPTSFSYKPGPLPKDMYRLSPLTMKACIFTGYHS